MTNERIAKHPMNTPSDLAHFHRKGDGGWPLHIGETVVYDGREYRVFDPGGLGYNAMLQSVVSDGVYVFVDPLKFDTTDFE